MRKIYNKLVRDRIPAIIQSECRDCQTRRLTSAEYQTELKAKLVEEAREVQEASDREALICLLYTSYYMQKAVVDPRVTDDIAAFIHAQK